MGQTDFSSEIFLWAQKELTEQWQHDLLKRVASGVTLTASYIDEVASRAVKASSDRDENWFCPDDTEPESLDNKFSVEDFGIRTSPNEPVRLYQVLHRSGVNRLQENQTLEVTPTGMTVVFGKNGSGKSGYARILKKFAASRGDNLILPNAMVSTTDTPSASISFLEGDTQKTAEWDGVENFVESDFQRVRVYDSKSAQSLLVDEQEVAYSPPQIRVLSRFAEALAEVKAVVEDRLRAITVQEHRLVGEENEKFSLFLSELSDATSSVAKEKIENIQNFAPSQEKTLAELEDQESRLRLDSREVLLQRIKRRQEALRGELLKAKQIVSVFRNVAIEDALKIRRAYEESLSAVNEVKKSLGNVDRLQICFSANWPDLWKTAGEFFASLPSHHDLQTSQVSQWKACPVCQQDLGPDAQNRLLAFENFVNTEANQRLKRAEDASQAMRDSLDGIKEIVNISEHDEAQKLAEVLELPKDLAESLIGKFEAFYLGSKLRVAELERILLGGWQQQDSSANSYLLIDKEGAGTDDPLESFDALEQFFELCDRNFRDQHRQLQEMAAGNGEEGGLDGKISELRLLRLLSINREALKTGHDTRLAEAAHRDALRKCKGRSATSLVKKLSIDFIEEISSSFSAELVGLGFDPAIPVSLSLAKTSRGINYIKPRFNSLKNEKMGEILSEGEQRIVSMAGFFADLTGAQDGSCLIFDDPVTSLDHRFREKVAQRLVREMAVRQVVVFSHDFAFVRLLEQALKEENLTRTVNGEPHLPEISERQIHRRASGAGVVEQTGWKRRQLSKQLSALNTMYQELEALYRKDPDSYPEAGQTFLGAVRETWERVVEETLLNSAVIRMDPAVHTQNLKPLTDICEKDLASVQRGMNVESRLMRGHSKAGEIAAEDFPRPDVLKDELDNLKQFHKNVRKRRN